MTNMPVTATERMLLGKPGVSTRDTTGPAADSSAGREVMSDQISPPIHSRPAGQLPGRLTPGPTDGSGPRGLGYASVGLEQWLWLVVALQPLGTVSLAAR